MRILVSSHAFAPSLGGIETVSRLLAQEFVTLGHDVTVVTQTSGEDTENFPVVRRPSVSELFGLINWCDIFWHNNLSLRTLWPVFLWRRPVVITHAGSYCRRPAGLDLALRLKRAVVNRVTSVAISQYAASFFTGRSIHIPNPYDARTFHAGVSNIDRKRELVFLGRLVSEKGLDLLLEALNRLRSRQLRPGLTVVGTGPELSKMQQLATKFGLQDQVEFIGPKSGVELAQILNHHEILVVPSRYEEPFGVVALEGIACGCAVIGSSGGGLPDAIGPCGITFPNGDISVLEKALERLLTQPDERERLASEGPRHLVQFQPHLVAQRYLELFQTVAP